MNAPSTFAAGEPVAPLPAARRVRRGALPWLMLAACLPAGVAAAPETPPAAAPVIPPPGDAVKTTRAAADAAPAPAPVGKEEPKIQPVGNSGRSLLTLEELMDTKIVTLGSLTTTDLRRTPASISVITAEMIQNSGARNLREALVTYVPNFQSMLSHSVVNTWGMRGVMADLNDKYLILVNGRKMNETLVYGVATEMDLSMLGELERIEVVRGPGSALYGSGAIGGVINLVTDEGGLLAPGQKEVSRATVALGFVEDYGSISLNHVRRLTDVTTLSIFYGIDAYPGVDAKDAPVYYPYGSIYNTADRPFGGKVADYNGAPDDMLRQKLMVQLSGDDFKSWVRVTHGGFHGQPAWWAIDGVPATGNAGELRAGDIRHRYTQVTWHNEYTAEWNESLKSKIEAGFQSYDLTQENIGISTPRYMDSREFMSRLTNTARLGGGHELAFGGEVSLSYYDASAGVGYDPPFDVFKQAAFAEYQWKLNRHVTLFAGARADFHPHAETALAPRAALILTPTDEDTLRFNWDRSFRSIGEMEIKRAIVRSGADRIPNEFIEHEEVAYTRKLTKELDGTITVFNYKQEMSAYNFAANRQNIIGELSVAGAELELNWKTERGVVIGLSHGYTQLYDFKQRNGYVAQYVTTDGIAPGSPAGTELLSWPTHISKLQLHVPVNNRLSLDGSVVVYWYYQGLSDVHDYYANSGYTAPIATTTESPEFRQRFGPVVNVHFGATWKFDENRILRLHVFNALAFFDRDITIEHYRAEPDYRTVPGTVSLTYEYRF